MARLKPAAHENSVPRRSRTKWVDCRDLSGTVVGIANYLALIAIIVYRPRHNYYGYAIILNGSLVEAEHTFPEESKARFAATLAMHRLAI